MKKILSAFFAAFLLASLCALPTFAASQVRSTNAATTAEPAVLVCEYCGQSDMICVDEYYASWYTVNFIPCQGRDPRYNDSVENRTHVEIYQCQSCKFGTSVVSTEEQISHKHPAMRAYDLPRFWYFPCASALAGGGFFDFNSFFCKNGKNKGASAFFVHNFVVA